MINEITSQKSDSTMVKLTYLDISPRDESNGEISIMPCMKTVELVEQPDDVDLKEIIAKYLEANVKEPKEFPVFVNDGSYSADELKRKITLRITMHSHLIANEGRLGTATTIVMNADTNTKYNDDCMSINDIGVVINDNIPDDTFYIIHNNVLTSPGFKFIYHIDNNNKLYASVVGVGFFPEKQASKLVIH